MAWNPDIARANGRKHRKLTDPQVREIKRLLLLEKWMRAKGKLSNTKQRPKGFRVRIAERFGVSVWCIKRIIDHRTYRHVRVAMHYKWREQRRAP